MNQIKAGTYAHRFQGNALDKNETVYYLAGLGRMELTKIDSGYKVVGQQESVLVPFRRTEVDVTKLVKNRRFMIDGNVVWSEERLLWTATITFTGVGPAASISTRGTYVLSPNGQPDQFWIMSTGSTILTGSNVIPVEAVSGEARLLP